MMGAILNMGSPDLPLKEQATPLDVGGSVELSFLTGSDISCPREERI